VFDEKDMSAPRWRLHALSGNMKAHGSVSVKSNWRITFMFDEGDFLLVD
jgi:proteic killer suppression protein